MPKVTAAENEKALGEASQEEASQEIEKAKVYADQIIAEAKAKAAEILAKADKAAEKVAKLPEEKLMPKSDKEIAAEALKKAMEPTTVTIPKERGNTKPYDQTVLVYGRPAYHAHIPRGVPVKVPYYVADAIRQDIRQNDKTEILVQRLETEFLDKAKAIAEGRL